MKEIPAALPPVTCTSPGKSHELQKKLSFFPSREDQAAPPTAHGNVYLPDVNHVVQNNVWPS